MNRNWVAILLLLVFSFSVYAEEEDESETAFTLGEIIVEGARTPAEKTATIQEIDEEDIRAMGAVNVAEAIGSALGTRVDAAPTSISANGKQEQLVSLRGFDPRNVIVLIDGVPVYEPYYRVLDLRQIPVAGISKIKIIKGPTSVLYGPNGMGGVINIITKRGAGPVSGRMEGSYGDVDAYSGDGYVQGGAKGFDYFFAPGFSASKGFRISDDFHETRNEDGGLRNNSDYFDFHLTGRGGYSASLGSVSVSAQHYQFDGGVPFSMEATQPGTLWRKNWKKTGVSVHGDLSPVKFFYLRGRAFYTRYFNTITTYEDTSMSNVLDDGKAVSTFDNDVSGVVLMPEFLFGDAGGIALSGIYKLDRASTQDEKGGDWIDFAAETYSAAGEYSVHVWRLDFTIGAAYHFYRRVRTPEDSLGEDNNAFDFSAGVAISPVNELEIYVTGARKSSFPDLRSLYGGSGNADLLPEFSYNLDSGVRWSPVSQLDLEAVFFYSDVTDLIGKADTGNEYTYENIDEAEIYGLEALAGTQFFDDIFECRVGYTYMVTRDKRSERELEKLDFRPEHKVDVDARVNLPFGTRLAVQYVFVSEREFERAGSTEHEVDSLPEFGLFNARIAHVLSLNETNMDLEFFVEGKNILDIYYQTAPDKAAPGRMLKAGLAFDF